MNLFLILFVIVESMMKSLNNDLCRAISFVLLCTLQNIYIGKYNTESYDTPPQKKKQNKEKRNKNSNTHQTNNEFYWFWRLELCSLSY